MIRLSIAAALAAGCLLGCQSGETTIGPPPSMTIEERGSSFQLPPAARAQNILDVWGTQYYTLTFQAVGEGVPFLGQDDAPVSAPISEADWCKAAVEGAAFVTQDGQKRLFNFADARGPEQADCRQFFSSLSENVIARTQRARFFEVDPDAAPFGCGVQSRPLRPFRTIAVDPRVIAFGTALFVPEIRGVTFTDEEGVARQHDGWFFAADRGGAIIGTHIDVFTGTNPANQLSALITNLAERTTQAWTISENVAASQWLSRLHAPSC